MKLKELLGKEVFFTRRGNASIKQALQVAKELGKTKLFLQDQGGWITYAQFGKKLFDICYIETDYGIIDAAKLRLDKECVLLVNSMPGYFALQDMAPIAKICKRVGCFLINDVSGSIGTKEAKYGDIILGSFGRWKPVNLGNGGFITGDYEFKEVAKPEGLDKELNLLPKKLKFFRETAEKIKSQLKDYDVIHRESPGLNVIVKTPSPEIKAEIIDFCKAYGYEYTLCPRYIRVLKEAVSIEVKRLHFSGSY